MLPVARGANGQPPSPPIDASNIGRAVLDAGQRVRVAGVAGVVEMQTHRAAIRLREHVRQQPANLLGDADADRVGEHDLVDTGRHHACRVLADDARVDLAFERTTEGRTERDRHPEARRVGLADHHLGGVGGLGERHPLVSLRERVGQRIGEMDLVDASLERPLHARWS